ncbi:hypothetical protein [Sporomusa sp. GT1]|nr:hypothetical protein [Sporomusa sp. GT1]
MKYSVGVDRDLEDLIPEFLQKRQEDINAIVTAADSKDPEAYGVIGIY